MTGKQSKLDELLERFRIKKKPLTEADYEKLRGLNRECLRGCDNAEYLEALLDDEEQQ